ncbi:hypothetical protein ZWY2020_012296 [Hordeum vulgare]|nr:hypothetical protein ZWY2020_012296 [Hordeum vulgare]
MLLVAMRSASRTLCGAYDGTAGQGRALGFDRPTAGKRPPQCPPLDAHGPMRDAVRACMHAQPGVVRAGGTCKYEHRTHHAPQPEPRFAVGFVISGGLVTRPRSVPAGEPCTTLRSNKSRRQRRPDQMIPR